MQEKTNKIEEGNKIEKKIKVKRIRHEVKTNIKKLTQITYRKNQLVEVKGQLGGKAIGKKKTNQEVRQGTK